LELYLCSPSTPPWREQMFTNTPSALHVGDWAVDKSHAMQLSIPRYED